MNILKGMMIYWRLIRHQRKFSPKQIKAYQWKQIKKILKVSQKKSPFYRTYYENTLIHTIEQFHTLPAINKTMLMENFDTINTVNIKKSDAMSYALAMEETRDFKGYYQKRYVVGLSSGTSGNKGLYITPKSLTKKLPFVFLARGGVKLNELPFRILFLLRVFSQGFQDINAPFIQLSYASTMTDAKSLFTMMAKQRTNILMAPPSMLNQLIKHAHLLNNPLKRIITYAEVLTKEDKARLEKAFDTLVVEIYQASEGQIASPCKEGHLHINEDLVYVEIYDAQGQRVTKPHCIGQKMFVTNLVNHAQPLIRYEMNDLIILDDPCPCGSSFRRIKHILGRHDDVLWGLKNNEISPLYPDLCARFIMTANDNIREFQVFQTKINALLIVLDPFEIPLDIPQIEAHITDKLAEHGFTFSLTFRVETIELPKEKNKFKRFISAVHD